MTQKHNATKGPRTVREVKFSCLIVDPPFGPQPNEIFLCQRRLGALHNVDKVPSTICCFG